MKDQHSKEIEKQYSLYLKSIDICTFFNDRISPGLIELLSKNGINTMEDFMICDLSSINGIGPKGFGTLISGLEERILNRFDGSSLIYYLDSEYSICVDSMVLWTKNYRFKWYQTDNNPCIYVYNKTGKDGYIGLSLQYKNNPEHEKKNVEEVSANGELKKSFSCPTDKGTVYFSIFCGGEKTIHFVLEYEKVRHDRLGFTEYFWKEKEKITYTPIYIKGVTDKKEEAIHFLYKMGILELKEHDDILLYLKGEKKLVSTSYLKMLRYSDHRKNIYDPFLDDEEYEDFEDYEDD